jgi:hypothetical protein
MEKITTVFTWFAGFFEDQKGSASSKRAALYLSFGLLYLLVNGSLEGKSIDINILLVIGGLILFLVGAVTSEFFNKINGSQNGQQSSTNP